MVKSVIFGLQLNTICIGIHLAGGILQNSKESLQRFPYPWLICKGRDRSLMGGAGIPGGRAPGKEGEAHRVPLISLETKSLE